MKHLPGGALRAAPQYEPTEDAPYTAFRDRDRLETVPQGFPFPEVLRQAPFAGKAYINRSHVRPGMDADFVVAIPVRNEDALLPRCLTALGQIMADAERRGAAVIIVHDTNDGSYELARRWMDTLPGPGCLLDMRLAPDIRSAAHARRLALDIASRLTSDGILFTTDADSQVAPGWVEQLAAQIDRGCDLVCEDVRLDEEELSRLPGQVRDIGNAERAYFQASEALWRKWTKGCMGAFAHRASGASMAFTAAAYRSLGGLRLPSVGEDTAFCEAAVAAGLEVVTLPDCGTRTSARLQSRAHGGCGETLLHRSQQSDPPCDHRLVSVATLRRLAETGERSGALAAPPLTFSEVLAELAIAHRLLGWTDG